MKYAITILMTLILLTSCAGGNSNVTPDLIKYTKKEQNLVADELQKNEIPTIKNWLKDYKKVRDQIRTIKKNSG